VLGIPARLRSLGIFYFAINSSSMSFWQTTVSRTERRIMIPEVCIEHVSLALYELHSPCGKLKSDAAMDSGQWTCTTPKTSSY